jgi:2-polyprenyl-6-methoxyphenol hydroxylase-like FAD-dependent oxidoreductase
MAALLQFARPRRAATTAAVARLRDAVQATLDRHAQTRPKLSCRWLQGADGRLSCHWEAEFSDPFPPY